MLFTVRSRRQTDAAGDLDADALDRLRTAVDAARKGHRDTVARLGDMLVNLDGQVGHDDARQVLSLVSVMPWLVLRLDENARSPYTADPEWAARASVRLRDRGVIAAALASMCSDGRMREAAVALMVELAAPETGPFLVLRTADWVGQVRSRARAGLAVLLHDAPAAWIPTVASTAFLLSRRVRADFARQQVDAALRFVPDAMLGELVARADQATRRAAFDVALSRRVYHTGDLARFAIEHPDRLVALRAAEAAARDAVWTGNRRVLDGLVRARTADVRALGLIGLTRAGQSETAGEHLADDAALVRAIARDAIRPGGRDPAAWYRTMLDGDAARPGALAGLAECGTGSDGALLERFLVHPSARVRAAAVSALRAMSAADPVKIAPLLHDPSARVVRQAAAALRPVATMLDPEPLRGLLTDSRRHARRAAYSLLRRRDGWERLRAALLVVADDDAALAGHARTDVLAWARHEPDPPDPPPAELAALVAQIALLGEPTAGLLRARLTPRRVIG